MQPLLSKPSSAAPTSLFYITLGALMAVWSAIWFFYLRNNPPTHPAYYYVCLGFLCTGLVLMTIGFALGPLSRMARHAELPPAEVTHDLAEAQPNAVVATPSNVVVATNPNAGVATTPRRS